MSPSIKQGLVPPEPGLEKEEPEQANEADIPSDDGTPSASEESQEPREERPLRQVERE